MAKGINKKNLEKLKKFVHSQRNIPNDRNTGQQSSADKAVWPR